MLESQAFLASIIEEIKSNMRRFAGDAQQSEKLQSTADIIGKCPLCGRDIQENAKAYGCSGYRDGCRFVIWKTVAGKIITRAQAQQLLTKGQTGKLKGFTGKKGKFDAALVLKPDGTVGFQFS